MFKQFKKLALATALLAGVTAGTTGTAAAGTADVCTNRSTKQAFAPWGDTNEYFEVRNGTFESGTGGWTMTGGPRVVSRQEPWKVNGSSHSRALRLPGGSTAEAPFMCVEANEETMRFFYKDPGVSGSRLRIELLVDTGSTTSSSTLEFGSTSAGWKVSQTFQLPSARGADGRQWISMRFASTGTAANWLIDDVMVDPWVNR